MQSASISGRAWRHCSSIRSSWSCCRGSVSDDSLDSGTQKVYLTVKYFGIKRLGSKMTGTDGTGGEIWALRERVVIRGLKHRELDEADRIMRLAFGTYLKAPNPIEVFGDADWVHTRHKADPSAAFCAELDGEVVGSNFATRWGSFGFFGPLTVRPDLWDGGIASRLMEPIMQLFEQWGVRHAGLFTFPESPKHVGLYQKFGFWPQGLHPVLARDLVAPGTRPAIETFSTARAAGSGARVLAQCRQVASTIYDGLDLTRE